MTTGKSDEANKSKMDQELSNPAGNLAPLQSLRN